ncbi:MAG: hypothetical protein ILP16_11965, partial [Spirochaetales bacterium]|nr:hypothetical protein [Spirochaetales bacterium]
MLIQMGKYPINKEFFPYSKITPRINTRFIRFTQKMIRTPGFIKRIPGMNVRSQMIPAYKDGEIEIIIFTPEGLGKKAPCFVDIHGGGFVF